MMRLLRDVFGGILAVLGLFVLLTASRGAWVVAGAVVSAIGVLMVSGLVECGERPR